MATSITTINSTDLITNSRADINNNFDSILVNKMETSVLDTDTTLAANSDSKVPTQKAVKAYVDAGGNVNASETTKGIVEEATDAEVTAGTATGGSGAKLFVTPAKLNTQIAALETTKKIYISTTEVTFTNGDGGGGADVEQTVFSTSIPANSLGTNNALRFKAYIRSANINATTTPWTIRIKYGGSTIGTMSFTAPASNILGASGYLEGFLIADGSTSAQKLTASGLLVIPDDSELAADASVGITKYYMPDINTSAAVNSASSQTFAISCQMTNQTNNDGVFEWVFIELIK